MKRNKAWNTNLKKLTYVACWLISVFFFIHAAEASEKAYSSRKQPLTGFMKMFTNIPKGDLSIAKLALFFQSGITCGDFKEMAAGGKAFYEGYHNQFDKIYQDWDKILANLPTLTSQPNIKAARLYYNPVMDFRFCRDISRCFQLVSLYHFEQRNFERAVKTMLLLNWFSHSIARGHKSVPKLIDLIISISIRNMAISEVLWSSLACGEFSPIWLKQIENILVGLESSQPEFAQSLELDFTASLSSTRHLLLDGSSNLVNFPTKLIKVNRKDMADSICDHMEESNRRILNIFTAYRQNPKKINDELDVFIESIKDSEKARMSDFCNITRKIGQSLVSIGTLNFFKSYDQYLQARYREKGAILLVQFLLHRKKDHYLPKTAAEFAVAAQANIPFDLYDAPKTACRYVLDKDWMTLYSIGIDQIDQGGDPKKDVLLFKVPVKFLNR